MMIPTRLEDYHVRKLWPFDRDAFRAHLKRLDAETRQLRFGAVVNDGFLDSYAETIAQPGAVIFGAFHGGEIHASAEMRPLDGTAEPSAEAAFTVEKPYQDHGLGSLFMDRIITAAQNRGIHHLCMVCLRDNGRMQHLADKFGARLKVADGEVTGELETRHPTFLSLFEEGVHDMQGVMTAMLDWQVYSARAMPGTQA
jgi:GNAT superfamily N-acetyltransferase